MNADKRFEGRDIRAGLIVLALAACDLLMRELYYRVSSESVGAAIIVAGSIALTVALGLGRRLALCMKGRWVGRMALLLAIGFALEATLNMSARVAPLPVGLGYALIAATAVLAVLLVAVSQALWIRIRLALVVGTLIFFSSQLLLGYWRADTHLWPQGENASNAEQDREKLVTIMLLFDELNASASGPFVQELEAAGLVVSHSAVPSVGNSTADVVPSMFAGQIFTGAGSCGWHTICGERLSLDFSRIMVSRPDIDVVGFYHPYCNIIGLRSCKREAVTFPVLDLDRIKCALWRRIGWPTEMNEKICRGIMIRAWSTMVNEVIHSVREAPAIRQGGLLFAHIPLPHPPGSDPHATLAEHYAANVGRAVILLHDLLKVAKTADLRIRVVIFSDHPLRQSLWCNGFSPYRWDLCKPVAALEDDRVPLIAAGESAIDLGAFVNNLNAFSIASMWRDRQRVSNHSPN